MKFSASREVLYKPLKDCQGSSYWSLSDDPLPASASSGDGPSGNSPRAAPVPSDDINPEFGRPDLNRREECEAMREVPQVDPERLPDGYVAKEDGHLFRNKEDLQRYRNKKELTTKAREKIIEAAAEGNSQAWVAFAILDFGDTVREAFSELRDTAPLPELSAIARELKECGDKIKEGLGCLTTGRYNGARK
jgi:hypothetical protein